MTTSPVAIGGQGGSGTRVFAAMLQALGYDIGADLNRALDNLWYTILLKRRSLDDAAARVALDVFVRAMRRELPLADAEVAVVTHAAAEVAVHGHSTTGSGRGGWALKRAASLLDAQSDPPPERWGWKEPNTHLRLPLLAEAIPDLRYIHVVRHGLDMAFSRNQAQLRWWGPQLGIEAPSDPAALPPASLRYWAQTTQRAVAIGEELLGERFLLLRFEDACDHPETTARRLLAFLGHPADEATVARLAALPDAPGSVGRSAGVDLAAFDPADVEVVRRFGYAVG